MFSNSRDMTKFQFLHDNDDDTDAKAIAIPRIFLENSQDNKSMACGCQCPSVGCLIEDKMSKLKTGHKSEKKKFFFFWIVSLDSVDCPLDSEDILQVSSKYLQ